MPAGWRLRLRVVLFLASALALISGVAMAGSDVVRVPIPAKDVTKIFPPGTELRILSAREFESQVEAAHKRSIAEQPAAAPRLIRARHRARWDSGLLRGRSELVIGAVPAGPAEFPLEPWTPAILVGPGGAPAVGARDSGAAVLRVEASPREQAVRLDWELQPRPHSRGRGFSLGLPVDASTVLVLELPRGWVASSQRGVRRGPLPAEDPSLALWEIDGESGRFDIELGDSRDLGKVGTGSGAWMSATTVVDLRRTADQAGTMINWTADCRLELDPRHPGRMVVELDPGLELIDVQGPAVQGYRTERPGRTTRVTVTLAEGARVPTLRFLAHAQVPAEDVWTIPAFRPLDATWTGGRTTVVLDDTHALSECRERAGRLVPPGPGDTAPANRLAFEAGSPRSVADLVFIRTSADIACTVLGRVVMGGAPARLDCRLDWTLRRGSISQMEVDLSPAWLPDQVRIQGLDDQMAWHSSALPSGATRLRVMLPASVLARGHWTLMIGATSTAPAGRGPLELPRVHPVGTAIVDEAWLAWVDEGTMIRPARARGLAWIDPHEVPGLIMAPPAAGLREALAWRWTADAAEARVDRERIDQDPRASIRARARLATDGGALTIEGTLLVGSGAAALETLPVWVDGPSDAMDSWHFSAEDGSELRLRPIEGPARNRLDHPGNASVRALPVNLPALAEKAIRFRTTVPWSSPGVVPLLGVPREFLKGGIILVETPAGMKVRPQPRGLGRLNPSSIESPDAGRAPDGSDGRDTAAPRDRIVHAFSYTGPDARLELTTEPMVAAPMPGIIREALLTTTVDTRGRTLNSLRFLVHLDRDRPLDLDLPEGATPVRARRDGIDVTPIRSGSRLSIPAPANGQAGRSSTIVLDYLMEAVPIADGSVLHPDRPRFDLPCLSFTWEVAVPAGWRALDPSAGLVANDPEDPDDWPCGVLGLWNQDWPTYKGHGIAARVHHLDDRLGRPMPDSLSFAEWFTRWDSAPWPIVVDQLALSSAGLGPKSACVPGRSAGDRRGPGLALLQQHGLAIIEMSEALLITTESEVRRFAAPRPWLDAIGEALAWGSDRTNRFQSVEHWRGETSPRVTAAEEAIERHKPVPGRMIWRFSAPAWPADDAFIHLVDGRRRMLIGWIIAGVLAMAGLVASRRGFRSRFFLPALVAVACVLLDRILPARFGAATAGGFVAALAILIAELARRARRAPAPPGAAARAESSSIRNAPRPAIVPVLILAITGAWATLRAATSLGDDPIVALFPYEGTFDPASPPDRVILRLEDYRRLVKQGATVPLHPPTVTAVSAEHRVARRSEQDILVETEIELMARGRGPFAWSVPVSSARDISATMDGQAVPVAVEPGGTLAKVVIPGAGAHRLLIRRFAGVHAEETGAEVLNLPINAMPTARLVIEPAADGVPQGVPVARGRIERGPDRSITGRLGPSDRIVVRWTKPGRADTPRHAAPVEGLLLWDVTPAGDRVRARLTFRRTEEIPAVRLAHDAGLALRSVGAPGATRIHCEDDTENGQWLLSFDPPLPPTATLSVECWLPLPADAPQGVTDRRLPGIRPVGAERFAGIVGVRRPGDWTGRLEPAADAELINDETFVKAWGTLPEEPLTLSGTSRFNGDLGAVLRTGPAPPRVVVHPAEQLRVESGRIIVAVDADILEVSGHSPIMEAELPEGMHLTQVAGEGLLDWALAGDRRLHLTWQRRGPVPRGHIHIVGWIPLDEDPLKIGNRQHRVRTPWIGWPGADVSPGSLTIFSGTRTTLEGGTGLSPATVSAAPEPSIGIGVGGAVIATGEGAASPAPARLSYQVNDPTRLGELSWDSRPPRVAVVVESQITIHTDIAQWVAVVRYDVAGGALDEINLRIPSTWADGAKLHLSGDELQTTARALDSSTFWKVVPGRPLWGSHRFVLRSTLPLGADREIAYPEVAPLGWGAVDAYLGIVNATGHPLASPDATGLKPIAYATYFRDREFTRDAGTPAGAFHVEKEVWALRVPLPRNGTEPSGSRDDAARVALADVMLTVLPDRSIVGRPSTRSSPTAAVCSRSSSRRAAQSSGRPSSPIRPCRSNPAGESGRSCSITPVRTASAWFGGPRRQVPSPRRRPRPPTPAHGRSRCRGPASARVRRWSRCPRLPAWRSRGFRRVSIRPRWRDWRRPGPTGWTRRSAMPWRRWTAAPAASTSDSWPC
jgi:hypothetical protein